MHLLRALVLLAGLLAACPGPAEGAWGLSRRIAYFGASSPPDPPLVLANAQGRLAVSWNVDGYFRYSEKAPNGPGTVGGWTSPFIPSPLDRFQATANSPPAAALGPSGASAVAFSTVGTRRVPSKLYVSLRAPGAPKFPPAVAVAPGTWYTSLVLDCSGTLTLGWTNGSAVVSTLAGVPGPGPCTGVPPVLNASAAWPGTTVVLGAAAGAPLLAANAAGATLAVFMAGSGGGLMAALRPAGALNWGPASLVANGPVWAPTPMIDADGRPSVGYQASGASAGTFLVRGTADGSWGGPEAVPGAGGAAAAAFACDDAGNMLASWQDLDPDTGLGVVRASTSAAGGGTWSAPVVLSGPDDDAQAPSAAASAEVLVVGFVDNAQNNARVAVRAPAGATAWSKTATQARGWWGSTVVAAAASNAAIIGWAMPGTTNVNAASLVVRPWSAA